MIKRWKREKMDKLNRKIDMSDTRIQITSTSLTLLWRIMDKVDDLVEGYKQQQKDNDYFQRKIDNG